MNHDFYTDRLSAYYDMELKNEEFVMVDQHVQNCPECLAIIEEFKKFDSVVEENSMLAGDDYFEKAAQKIEAAISGPVETEVVEIQKKSSSMGGLWWKLAGVAATLAVIAFISLYESDITDNLEIENQAAPETTADNDSVLVDKDLAVEESDASAKGTFDTSAAIRIERQSSGTIPVTAEKDIVDKFKSDNKKEAAEEIEAQIDKLADNDAESIKKEALQPKTSPQLTPQSIQKSDKEPELLKSKKIQTVQTDKLAADSKEKADIVSEPLSKDISADESAKETPYKIDRVQSLVPKKGSAKEILDEVKEEVADKDLSYWQNQKAQLEGSIQKLSSNSLRTVQPKRTTTKKATELSNTETAMTLKLLEAHYNIARLSEDKKEREESVDYLKEMSENEDKSVVEKASEYLKLLKIKH